MGSLGSFGLIFIIAMVAMHLFMGRGHGHGHGNAHGNGENQRDPENRARRPDDEDGPSSARRP